MESIEITNEEILREFYRKNLSVLANSEIKHGKFKEMIQISIHSINQQKV